MIRNYESNLLAKVEAALAAIHARRSSVIADVRRDLVDGLRLVVDASFAQRPGDYATDLATMNADPRWTSSKYHQSATIPPKYFGGNPAAITPHRYVLHISLNHRLLDDTNYPEYVALRSSGSHFEACTNFFLGEHYYERSAFFPSRAKVLRSWVCGNQELTSLSDRDLLNCTSLFIESIPTWSKESIAPSPGRPTNFCLALNELARRFFITLAPPAVILIAGNSAHTMLNEHRTRTRGKFDPWQGARVPQSPAAARRFRVARNSLTVGPHTVRVIRCGFLKTPSGANSDEDLRVLGRLLAGDDFDSHWPRFSCAE